MEDSADSNQIRLDKWLWVARLYKTRVLAQSAIVSGKIRYNQQRAKPCSLVEIGATIRIQQQARHKIVIVKSLSEKRYPLQADTRFYEEINADHPISSASKKEIDLPNIHLPALYNLQPNALGISLPHNEEE